MNDFQAEQAAKAVVGYMDLVAEMFAEISRKAQTIRSASVEFETRWGLSSPLTKLMAQEGRKASDALFDAINDAKETITRLSPKGGPEKP